MEPVVVMTVEQVETLMRKVVREELDSSSAGEREVLTCKEAADLVGVHPYTLAKLARKEKLGRRIGKEWRFTRTELNEWIARKRA